LLSYIFAKVLLIKLTTEICGDKIFFLPNARLYHFGILTSTMLNAWMRAVCGRMRNDYSYSNTIVYNNLPFPDGRVGNAHSTELKPSVRKRIETAAQKVLDARKAEQDRYSKNVHLLCYTRLMEWSPI
jgi:hypothetical protein